jgi:hypothetical protein
MSRKGELSYSVHTHISTWKDRFNQHWLCPVCSKEYSYGQPITYVVLINWEGQEPVICESCARARNLIW